MANRMCSAPGCEETVIKARGLCNAHYRRMLRGAPLEPERPRQPGGICSVPDCEEKTRALGLCDKHYQRQRNHGDPLYVAPVTPLIDRFRENVSKDGPIPAHAPELGPCWPWTGGTDDSGYGIFYFTDEHGKHRKTRAHRWLLGHLRGKPLSREVVGEEDGCHKCDNPPCCNPDHLYVGTRAENIADAVERGRLWMLKLEACPKGHPLDGVKTQKGKTRRYCKRCSKDQQRKRRTEDRKNCKNGHRLEGDNIVLCKNGTRKCRLCEGARVARMIERKVS